MRADHDVLEMVAGTMQLALRRISQEECLYEAGERPTPCDCPGCAAKHALAASRDWRRRCSDPNRLNYNPRERKIVDAFAEQIGDRGLSAILREDDFLVSGHVGVAAEHRGYPSVRDWFVALSVVRWLATNCGMEVLRAAGWVYGQYEDDREARQCPKCSGTGKALLLTDIDGVLSGLCEVCKGTGRRQGPITEPSRGPDAD